MKLFNKETLEYLQHLNKAISELQWLSSNLLLDTERYCITTTTVAELENMQDIFFDSAEDLRMFRAVLIGMNENCDKMFETIEKEDDHGKA